MHYYTTAIALIIFSCLLCLSSLSVSVWAYCRSRSRGWLVLIVASLIDISVALATPAIQQSRRQAWDAAVQRSAGGSITAYPFPYEQMFSGLAAVLFPVGLWLIARGQLSKGVEPSAGANAA